MAVLIIGATGYIGSHIYKILRNQDKEQCIGTRFCSINSELVKFDLLNDDIAEIDKEIRDRDKKVIFCSADGNIEYCLKNRDKAYEKNVISTIRTMDRLEDLGYHITFLSTDNVFDGTKGDYTEDDEANPINEYGKMKREVEEYLKNNISNSCIVRIGKAVGNFSYRNDVLHEWYKKAMIKEPIYCIRGNKMNLIHVDDITDGFSQVINNKLTGVYHIAGRKSGLRKDMCRRFLEFMKVENKIVELDLGDFSFLEKRPLNTSMKSTKFIKKTGYQFMELEAIWECFRKHINLGECKG